MKMKMKTSTLLCVLFALTLIWSGPGPMVAVVAQPPGAIDPEGRFAYLLNGELVAEETFTFTARDDGNVQLDSAFILLSEEFLLEFETDRLFDQTIVLTPDWELVSYELTSDTAQGTFTVQVVVSDGVASIHFMVIDEEGEETQGEQDVILEDDVIASGVSGSGAQLMLLQRLIFNRGITERTTLLALNPTDPDRPLVEVAIEPLPGVTVQAGDETFPAQRFGVSQSLRVGAGEEEVFEVELLSHEGRMIGYRATSATSTLLVYRADLFPDGIEIVE